MVWLCPNREAVTKTFDKPVITTKEGVLKSSYATGNQWLLNSSPISNATNASFTPKESGTYGLTVSSNDCKLNAEPMEFTVTGINNDEEKETTLALYPNPVINTFRIKSLMISANAKVVYYIYQQNGTIVQKGNIIDPKKEIGVGNLSAGLYLVKIMAGDKIQFGKLIKR